MCIRDRDAGLDLRANADVIIEPYQRVLIPTAVSYTHLDVYKRQTFVPSWPLSSVSMS